MELMDGVTIVDRISINRFEHADFIFVFLAAFILSMAVIVMTDSFGAGAAMFIMTFCFAALIFEPSSDEHYQYKCTVDSSVTIETLQEQYDIVEIKDGFVVLEDKETESETESETTESAQDCCCCCCHKSTHE